jgi:hypothetical protein
MTDVVSYFFPVCAVSLRGILPKATGRWENGGQFLPFDISIFCDRDLTSGRPSASEQYRLTRPAAPISNERPIHLFPMIVCFLITATTAILRTSPLRVPATYPQPDLQLAYVEADSTPAAAEPPAVPDTAATPAPEDADKKKFTKSYG